MPSNTDLPRPDVDEVDPEETRTRPKPAGRGLGLSFSQVAGGALAAMTAAALGSRLGVAGTIVGAALASVCAAVLGSVYAASIRRTREAARSALQRATPVLRTARGRQLIPHDPKTAGRRLTLTEADLDPSRIPITPTAQPVDQAGPRVGVRSRHPRRSVIMVAAAGSAVIFGIALAAILGIEAVTGRSLDGRSGGTTIGQVVHGSHPKGADSGSFKGSSARPSAQPSAEGTASDAPSGPATQPPPEASGRPSEAASAEPTERPSGSTPAQPSGGSTADPGGQPSGSGPGPSAGTDPGTGSGSGTGSGAGSGLSGPRGGSGNG